MFWEILKIQENQLWWRLSVWKIAENNHSNWIFCHLHKNFLQTIKYLFACQGGSGKTHSIKFLHIFVDERKIFIRCLNMVVKQVYGDSFVFIEINIRY